MDRVDSTAQLCCPNWPAALRQASVLLLVSIVAAGGLWAFRSEPLPLTAEADFYELEMPVPAVSVADALVLYDEGDYLFVDTRPTTALGEWTIPGAFRIRAARFDDDLFDLADDVYPEDPLVLFGSGDLTGVVHVAELLVARGFEDLLILRGSVPVWRDAGGDVSPNEILETEVSP